MDITEGYGINAYANATAQYNTGHTFPPTHEVSRVTNQTAHYKKKTRMLLQTWGKKIQYQLNNNKKANSITILQIRYGIEIQVENSKICI